MNLNFFFYLIVFLFGLAIGSFLNCVIYRLILPNFSLKKLGGLKGRSYCPHCKHTLSWRDLIPLLSFLILREKCRYCRKKISWQYPLVEISTGLIFLLIFNSQFLWTPPGGLPGGLLSNEFSITNSQIFNAIYLFIISSFLIIIFVYDLKTSLIPDKIIYPAIFIALFYNFYQLTINNQQLAINNLLSAFGAAFFFFLIFLISRGKWLGFGDVKLAFFMGLFLGYPKILVGLFLAFFIGAIIGVGLILAGKKKFKSEVPFGPFLVSGTFIALFWGQAIIDWYFQLFFF